VKADNRMKIRHLEKEPAEEGDEKNPGKRCADCTKK